MMLHRRGTRETTIFSFCAAPVASIRRSEARTRLVVGLGPWSAAFRAQESKLVPEEDDGCWDAPNLGRRSPIDRIRGAQGVEGISNTVYHRGPAILSTAAARRSAAQLWPFLASSPFLVCTSEPLRLAYTTATFVHPPWAVGRLAAYGLRRPCRPRCQVGIPE